MINRISSCNKNQSVLRHENEEIDLIKDIALKSLKELIICISYAGAACFFVQTGIQALTCIISSIAIVAGNTFLRIAEGHLKHRLEILKIQNPQKAEEKEKRIEWKKEKLQLLTLSNFIFFDHAIREPLMQEITKSFFINIFYKNAKTKIRFIPFRKSTTTYIASALSEIGKRIGQNTIHSIILAAAPLITLISILFFVFFSHHWKNKRPILCRSLNHIAVNSTLNLFFSSCLSLFENPIEKNHSDFYKLWIHTKIHPLCFASASILAPLILKTTLIAVDSLLRKKSTFQVEKQENLSSYFLSLKNFILTCRLLINFSKKTLYYRI